jgi:hypothetical protein
VENPGHLGVPGLRGQVAATEGSSHIHSSSATFVLFDTHQIRLSLKMLQRNNPRELGFVLEENNKIRLKSAAAAEMFGAG